MGLQAYVIFPAPSDLQFDTSPRAGGWCGQHTILQQYWSCLTALVSLSDNSAASQRCCLPYNRGCPGITQHKLELQPKWRVVWGDGTETNPVGLLAHRSYSELEINPTRVACSTHMSALCSPQPQVTVLNLFCNHRWLCSSFLWLMFLGHHWHPTSDRGRGSVTSVAKSMKTVFIWSLWREKRWRKKKQNNTHKTNQTEHTHKTNQPNRNLQNAFRGGQKTKVKNQKATRSQAIMGDFLGNHYLQIQPTSCPSGWLPGTS